MEFPRVVISRRMLYPREMFHDVNVIERSNRATKTARLNRRSKHALNV